jgi:Uma2 family endonuclease
MSVATPPGALPAPLQPLSRLSDGPILLTGIRWQTYEALLADIGDRAIRLTYDRGNLEIMSPVYRHEITTRWIGQLVEVLAEEFSMPYCNAGSTTYRREDLERGLEPDNCFYFANEIRVRGRMKIDLANDPPPDLAIEVDETSSSLNRMSSYAALRVPEVWRWRDGSLTVYSLQADGTDVIVQTSPTFPTIPLAGLAQFIAKANVVDQLTLKRAFREWVRKHIAQP